MHGGGMTYSIIAEGIAKRFAETTALNGIDLLVRTGTVFGLLGQNGAGKTTAVRSTRPRSRPCSPRSPCAPSGGGSKRPRG